MSNAQSAALQKQEQHECAKIMTVFVGFRIAGGHASQYLESNNAFSPCQCIHSVWAIT